MNLLLRSIGYMVRLGHGSIAVEIDLIEVLVAAILDQLSLRGLERDRHEHGFLEVSLTGGIDEDVLRIEDFSCRMVA